MIQATRKTLDHVFSGQKIAPENNGRLLDRLKNDILKNFSTKGTLKDLTDTKIHDRQSASKDAPTIDPSIRRGGSISLSEMIATYETSDRLKQCALRE